MSVPPLGECALSTTEMGFDNISLHPESYLLQCSTMAPAAEENDGGVVRPKSKKLSKPIAYCLGATSHAQRKLLPKRALSVCHDYQYAQPGNRLGISGGSQAKDE